MQLKLKRGVVLYDDNDSPLVSRYIWHVNTNGYARTNRYSKGEYRRIYMHQMIMGILPGYDIDHINGDKLDNRRTNLRYLTRTFNNHNTSKTTARSGVRGVYARRDGKWYARVKHAGVYHHSKATDSIEEAIILRDDLYRRYVEEYFQASEA